MRTAVELVALVAAATAVAGLAGRFGLSAPLVLTAVGIAGSYLPFVPDYPLEPDAVLFGILPPLLYATAIRTPVGDLRRNRRPIVLLSVGLVLATTAAVAVVLRLLLPDLPLAAAVALGAVVSPPDAVAATAVARRVGMPRRVVTLLEGESLLNDATALVTLRTAVAAVGGGASLLGASEDFVVAVVVGVVVGVAVALVASPIRRRVGDPVADTTLALLVPYVAYPAAESLEGSGVLAVVVTGLVLGHRSTDLQSAAARVTERVIWKTVQHLLESVVFLLIGLQLRVLLADAVDNGGVPLLRLAAVCAAVVAVVVVARIAWVFPGTYLPRLLPRVAAAEPFPPRRHVFLVSWAGMRGVVTLAAAFTLPPDLPFQPVLVIAAFAVVASTLLLQGATLPWVVRRLGVAGPDPAQDALQQAIVTQRATQAALERLDEESVEEDPTDTVRSLRTWAERQSLAAWERLGPNGSARETPAAVFRRLRVGMLEAQRQVIVDVRRSGSVPHDVLDELIERLDLEEAMLGRLSDEVVSDENRVLVSPHEPGACEHLERAPRSAVPRTPEVCGACVELGEHTWVHLRMCLDCGEVGCCDSSPNRHAERHFQESGHPVMRSVELGEAWRWCYVDELVG